MPLSLAGKIIIPIVAIAVLVGMSVVIYLVVTDEPDIPPTVAPGGGADPDTETTPGPDSAGGDNEPFLYEVGVGIADMTGPCVEIAFMGYAELSQRGQGIHTRQFSRAFIFVKDDVRVVLVTADVQSIGLAVRRRVVENLQELYGDTYSLRNVILTGTHTHSAPGGYLQNFLFDITILGFSQETFNAYVDGITRSIIRAHDSIVPARLFYGETKVQNAHMNRSPYSYEYNPEEERARYEGNTEDTLTQVRILRGDGGLHGVLTWYAVHTTSMNMSNHLISSDNLGYAALKLEKTLNPGSLPGKGSVVAGFFSSSLGDVSPNTRGARCEFSGLECDNHFVLCGQGERCFASGPGVDMFDSTRIIGNAVFEGAMEVLSSPGEELRGELRVLHQFVDMPDQTVPRYDPITRTFNENDQVSGCVPAMGYSFAAGTIDGANTLNITHGTIVGNPLLDAISQNVVAEPTPEDIACHAPKPILLMTGRAMFPVPWHPRAASASVVWLGGLVVLGVPGEPTTMAGRRLRAAVGDALERREHEPRVVVSGLTNEYIHYVCTFEEYQIQRYEAASTIYGPYSLDIFLNKFVELTEAAIQGNDVSPGIVPEDYSNSTLSLILPVIVDNAPIGSSFGSVETQPPATVRRGQTIRVAFVGANPRNDLRQESSYVVVQRWELGDWVVIATDADWQTKFFWERRSTILGTSRAEFEWTVPEDALIASYRMVYYGTARSLLGNFREFEAITNTFTIDAS